VGYAPTVTPSKDGRLFLAFDGVAQVFAGLVELAAGLLGGPFTMAGRDQQECGEEDEELHPPIVVPRGPWVSPEP